MGAKINKNSNITQNKIKEEKYNNFNVDNQKINLQEENKNKISDFQQKKIIIIY